MGKLNYIDDIEGYRFISDKGYEYDLLEGMTFGGNATSDIIFVLLSFNEDLTEKVDTSYVWHFYGATSAIEDQIQTGSTIKLLDKITKEYEERNNL